MSNTASNGGRELANDHVGIAARRARRGPDGWALANSGRGRVLVDVSWLRVTWPGSRLGLLEADAALAPSLATQRASETVPVAPDETTARQLLDRRPRVLVRHF